MKQITSGYGVIALALMLLLSVALNVGLAHKLNGFIKTRDAQIARIDALRLKPGAMVPPLSATRVSDGVPVTIGYDGGDKPTVLYVFSPACGWCTKNENSITQLIAEKHNDYRFIGVSLVEDGAAEYATAHDLGMPLYTGLSEDTKKAYKMMGTPQTIVVSPKGVVVANWNGAYRGKQKDAIEDFFKVRLPEIDLKAQGPGAKLH